MSKFLCCEKETELQRKTPHKKQGLIWRTMHLSMKKKMERDKLTAMDKEILWQSPYKKKYGELIHLKNSEKFKSFSL